MLREARPSILRGILLCQMAYNLMCMNALGGLYLNEFTLVHWVLLLVPALMMTFDVAANMRALKEENFMLAQSSVLTIAAWVYIVPTVGFPFYIWALRYYNSFTNPEGEQYDNLWYNYYYNGRLIFTPAFITSCLYLKT